MTAQRKGLPSGPFDAIVQFGANDIEWYVDLGLCYSRDCGYALENQRLNYEINYELPAKLEVMMATLKAYGVNRTVLVTYPDVFGSDDACEAFGFTAAEVGWMREWQAIMNQKYHDLAARFDNVEVVSPSISNGICSDDPEVFPPDTPGRFHLTESGQRVFADAVANAL